MDSEASKFCDLGRQFLDRGEPEEATPVALEAGPVRMDVDRHVVTVAGAKRQAVSLWELWSRRELNRNVAGINTSFLLGLQEINGALLYLNLGAEFGGLSSHEPHSLVAGATGSGKSVLIQALLLDIAATNSKDLAQLILIDPKMGVDYAPLADLLRLI